MKNGILAGLLVIVLVGFAPHAFAFGRMSGRGGDPEKRIEKIAKELGLSDEQKNKYLTGEKKIVEEAKDIGSKNKAIFAEIEKELLKESPDVKIIRGYLQQISQNRLQLQIERMDQMIELRKELTPEQREKLQKMMNEKKDGIKKHANGWKGKTK